MQVQHTSTTVSFKAKLDSKCDPISGQSATQFDSVASFIAPEISVEVMGDAQTEIIDMKDSVSKTNGDQSGLTYCGARKLTLTNV